MTIDELLLNVNNVSFNSVVRQTDVKTEKDKAALQRKGYRVDLTEEQFREKFQLAPEHIFYTPSLSCGCLYFNEETMAVCPFPVDYILHGMLSNIDSFYKMISSREEEVASNDFMGSIISLPDAMRMEYFNRLVEKRGNDIPGLYSLFFSIYTDSDYGFGNIAPETLTAILSAKTQDDKEMTSQQLQGLPEVLTVYRGGNTASVPYDKAYSWTLDINVANFFACRHGTQDGYIVQAEVSKEDVIEAFLEGRGEQEVCIDPKSIKAVHEIPVHGVDLLKQLLPEVTPMFHQYKEQMMNLGFAQASDEHGFEHEARVLLNSLLIARTVDLPLRDWRILATAAIFHDTQRLHDDDDSTHGKAAAEYYQSVCKAPDPIVSFLCEYHCRPDEEGFHEISENRKLNKNRTRVKQLYSIFKDADALDRVRFGIRALDLHQLRLPISKELTLVARLLKEQIKVPGQPKLRKPSLSVQISSASARSEQAAPEHHKTKEQPYR